MVALLRAWGGAVLVLIIGTAVIVRLLPPTAPGRSISPADQALRIHLPWLIVCALMVAASVLLYWRPPTRRVLLLAALPVPALAAALGVVAGAAGAATPLAALLYVGEAALGTAAGLAATRLFAGNAEAAAGHR